MVVGHHPGVAEVEPDEEPRPLGVRPSQRRAAVAREAAERGVEPHDPEATLGGRGALAGGLVDHDDLLRVGAGDAVAMVDTLAVRRRGPERVRWPDGGVHPDEPQCNQIVALRPVGEHAGELGGAVSNASSRRACSQVAVSVGEKVAVTPMVRPASTGPSPCQLRTDPSRVATTLWFPGRSFTPVASTPIAAPR